MKATKTNMPLPKSFFNFRLMSNVVSYMHFHAPITQIFLKVIVSSKSLQFNFHSLKLKDP